MAILFILSTHEGLCETEKMIDICKHNKQTKIKKNSQYVTGW